MTLDRIRNSVFLTFINILWIHPISLSWSTLYYYGGCTHIWICTQQPWKGFRASIPFVSGTRILKIFREILEAHKSPGRGLFEIYTSYNQATFLIWRFPYIFLCLIWWIRNVFEYVTVAIYSRWYGIKEMVFYIGGDQCIVNIDFLKSLFQLNLLKPMHMERTVHFLWQSLKIILKAQLLLLLSPEKGRLGK